MTTFRITKTLEVVCESQSTRYGFRHLARLQRNGWEEIARAKCCYYNRTWERYEFESVLEKLLDTVAGSLTKYELGRFKKAIRNGGEKDNARFRSIAMVAKFGELLTPDQKARNDWKKRMLNAGLGNAGLDFPEDWDTLTEDQKQERLDKAIAVIA